MRFGARFPFDFNDRNLLLQLVGIRLWLFATENFTRRYCSPTKSGFPRDFNPCASENNKESEFGGQEHATP